MTSITIDGVQVTLTDEQLKQIDEQREKRPLKLKPAGGASCWMLNHTGNVVHLTYSGTNTIYEQSFRQGNLALEPESLELKSKRNVLTQKLKDFIATENHKLGWVADWSDMKQQKCFLGLQYEHDSAHIVPYSAWTIRLQRLEDWKYFHNDVYQLIRKEFTDSELALIYLGLEV